MVDIITLLFLMMCFYYTHNLTTMCVLVIFSSNDTKLYFAVKGDKNREVAKTKPRQKCITT